MLYTLRFTAELDHTVEVEALDLDEAIAQADDDHFDLPDCEHLVEWHYTSATTAGKTVQEEPRLHEQRRDEVAALEVEVDRLQTQLADRDELLAELRTLLEMAHVFEVKGRTSSATVARHLDGWSVHPDPHEEAQHLTRDDALTRAHRLVN
ncbi:hypothetical protein ACWFMI_14975 [Nocardiopsis terrae]